MGCVGRGGAVDVYRYSDKGHLCYFFSFVSRFIFCHVFWRWKRGGRGGGRSFFEQVKRKVIKLAFLFSVIFL